MRVLRYWRIGIGAALTLGVAAAFAADPAVPTYPECTKKPSQQDNEAAKNAHKVATQFYDRGEYEKAIRSWNDAFEFDCTVNDLLINIANAYEKNGELAPAVFTLETYLKRTGPNPNVEQKVKNLKTRMAPPVPSASAPPPLPTASVAPTVTVVVPTATATVPPPLEGPRPHGNSPWFLVGGGGALAIVGAILLPVGFAAINSAEAACPNRVCPTGDSADINKGNTGRAEAGAGWGLLGVGVAAAAGGLVWQLAFNKPQPATPAQAQKAGVWATPVGGPGHAGVVAGGSF